MTLKLKQPKLSHQVIEAVLDRGEAKMVADSLKVSPQYVRSWTRPSNNGQPDQTGRRNPLENIEAIVDVVIENHGSSERAEPIAQYVSLLCGGHHVPAPSHIPVVAAEMLRHASKVLKETGEALECTRAAWFDESPGVLTGRESRVCLKEIDEAIVALHHFRNWVARG